MSRPSMMPSSRSLSLTEELERLEQSITLTLQGKFGPHSSPKLISSVLMQGALTPEIDHNFSRAHRIVTSSIIPTVEQYAKHSDAVWEGSKFWKQFFEASANVSLSGYEEAAENEDETALDETQTTARGASGHDAYGTPNGVEEDSVSTPGERPTSRYSQEMGDELLDSPSVTVAAQNTPRRQQQQKKPSTSGGKSSTGRQSEADEEETTFAEYPSPYETLRKEMELEAKGKSKQNISNNSHPSTPGPAKTTPGVSTTPFDPSTQRSTARRTQNPDPILHRVLDKNYRVQATPHYTGGKTNKFVKQATATAQDTKTSAGLFDSSPFSPAAAPPPQLRAEFFGSPSRGAARGRSHNPAANEGPRTPGITVQKARGTPAANLDFAEPSRNTLFHNTRGALAAEEDEADDSTDMMTMMSPPKTMQFHVPQAVQQQQGRLLQTPAKEASRRIVEDLLLSAGVAPEDSTLDDVGDGMGDDDENSPSVVRVAKGGGLIGGEDTF